MKHLVLIASMTIISLLLTPYLYY